MSPLKVEFGESRVRAWLRTGVLAALQACGAMLLALSLSSTRFWWLGWFTLLPLFLAVRSLSPLKAGLAGAFWGGCFYLGSGFFAATRVPHDPLSLVLLTAIPALFAGVASAVTLRKGFHPLLIGLGWAGVELALRPLALRHGLLASTQGDSLFALAVGNFGGYLLVAFLLALANAWLLSVFTSIPVDVPRAQPVPIPRSLRLLLPSFAQIWTPTRFLSPAQPRAPPLFCPVAG